MYQNLGPLEPCHDGGKYYQQSWAHGNVVASRHCVRTSVTGNSKAHFKPYCSCAQTELPQLTVHRLRQLDNKMNMLSRKLPRVPSSDQKIMKACDCPAKVQLN